MKLLIVLTLLAIVASLTFPIAQSQPGYGIEGL
jgi:hypothetical protein